MNSNGWFPQSDIEFAQGLSMCVCAPGLMSLLWMKLSLNQHQFPVKQPFYKLGTSRWSNPDTHLKKKLYW